jgi:PTS system sucrose-specific IIC component
MVKERELAQQILSVVGGRDNIAGSTFCMTRLRLTIVDSEKVDIAKLKKNTRSF